MDQETKMSDDQSQAKTKQTVFKFHFHAIVNTGNAECPSVLLVADKKGDLFNKISSLKQEHPNAEVFAVIKGRQLKLKEKVSYSL